MFSPVLDFFGGKIYNIIPNLFWLYICNIIINKIMKIKNFSFWKFKE